MTIGLLKLAKRFNKAIKAFAFEIVTYEKKKYRVFRFF